MVKQFTNLKHPVQNYPYRQTMDIIKPMIPYITNKVVCDIGCGCGDILVEIGKYAKSISGLELNNKFREQLNKLNIERPFIIWGDIFENGIPESDIYYIWVSSDINFNKRIVNLLPNGSLIMDGTSRKNIFIGFNNLELVDNISYDYDESELLGEKPVNVGVPFPTIGTNILRIYRKINNICI